VFVSSVVQGFEHYREAARQALLSAGADPILVNEDFPSLSSSSRNACLDAIDSCDILVSIVGSRGGWKTPSGRLVIDEEYEHARLKKIPILVFLENVDRDAQAQQFVDKISDYVTGYFRVTFESEPDLKSKIESAIEPLIEAHGGSPVNNNEFSKYMELPNQINNETVVRLVVTPERNEEVFDPLDFDKSDFLRKIFDVGHAKGVDLFSYHLSKKDEIDGEMLVVSQGIGRGHQGSEQIVVRILDNGTVSIDGNVTGRNSNDSGLSFSDAFVVRAEDINGLLFAGFKFVEKLYDNIDAYQRHQRFYYNVLIDNLGYRHIVKDYQPKNSHQMNMNSNGATMAYSKPRVVTRSELSKPNDEVDRVVSMLIRQSSTK
jgi:hypothetical protein